MKKSELRRIIREEIKKITEDVVPNDFGATVLNVKKGGKYWLYDDDENSDINIQILDIKKEDNNYYEVYVKFLSGEYKGKKDSVTLNKTDKVFMKHTK